MDMGAPKSWVTGKEVFLVALLHIPGYTCQNLPYVISCQNYLHCPIILFQPREPWTASDIIALTTAVWYRDNCKPMES